MIWHDCNINVHAWWGMPVKRPQLFMRPAGGESRACNRVSPDVRSLSRKGNVSARPAVPIAVSTYLRIPPLGICSRIELAAGAVISGTSTKQSATVDLIRRSESREMRGQFVYCTPLTPCCQATSSSGRGANVILDKNR